MKSRLAPFARPLLAVELGSCEMLATSQLFSLGALFPDGRASAGWLWHTELLVISTLAALALLVFPRRAEIGALWRETATAKSWRWPLAVNLFLFEVLLASSIAVSLAALMSPTSQPPWHLLALYVIPVLASAASLLWLAAPIAFWCGLFVRIRREFAGAVGIAIAANAVIIGWSLLVR